MTRLRSLALLALAAVAALTVAACGGDERVAATPTSNVDRLLRDTFSPDKRIESGRLNLNVELESRGAGPVVVRLAGPFESQGEGRLPTFALDAEVRADGETLEAGATSTGDAGYVSFQGEAYAVPGLLLAQLEAAYEQAHKQGAGGSFASLGMDPRRWLENPRNAGEARVGDTDTIKITGAVDVEAVLDDVDTALAVARVLGLHGADDLPDRLTPVQRRRAARAVQAATVEIYTGKDDHILRRLHVDLRVADAKDGSKTVALDLSLTGVNEGQDISAPSDPRPFDELMSLLRGLDLAPPRVR